MFKAKLHLELESQGYDAAFDPQLACLRAVEQYAGDILHAEPTGRHGTTLKLYHVVFRKVRIVIGTLCLYIS